MPSLNETHRRLREERTNVWSQAQTVLDTSEARADKAWTSEDETAWRTHNTELDTLDARIADLEATMERERKADESRGRYPDVVLPTDRSAGADADKPLYQRDSYRQAFNNYLARGITGIPAEQRQLLQGGLQNDEEFRVQTAGTTTAGGFTIPQGFYNTLEGAMKFYGGMLSPADTYGLPGNDGDQGNTAPPGVNSGVGVTVVRTDTGNALPFPQFNDTGNVGAQLAEGVTIGAQDIAFTSITLNAWTYTSKAILISWQLMQDSAFDLSTEIAMAAGERLGRILNTHLTVGVGTTQPLGVVNAATAGPVGATGETVGFLAPTATTNQGYDDLVALEHSVDLAYRQNGKYMFNDSTLKIIRKLKDAQGHPLWQPSLVMGIPSNVNGRDYVINNDMPVMAANARSILYGDFSRYKVRIVRTGALVHLQERYADQLSDGFFVWIRADGNIVDAGGHPIAYFANSAT